MKHIIKTLVISLTVLGLLSFVFAEKSYKCLVQLKNYDEQGAYVVISLINPKGEYQSTLNIMGDDPDWYEYLKSWNDFFKKSNVNIDAISGESIMSGERRQVSLKINESLLNKGYKIRFESAVEDFDYHKNDAEIEFSSENFGKKIKGKGYVRYVTISK